MDRKCLKCKKSITSDDFICPHCGAVIGDPISYSAAIEKNRTKKKRFAFRVMVCAMLSIALIAVACTIGWFMRSSAQQGTTVSNQPAVTTVPTPPQTTAPLAVYTACVKTDNKTDLTGAKVHVYLHDQLLYTGELDKNGDVTFILPECEGYSILLTDLPIQFQVNYDQVDFPFAEGERYQLVILESKPVTFTIKFVNSSGEPVPGVGLVFYTSGKEDQQQVSDDSGCCAFVTEYGDGKYAIHSANISFVPNGYYLPNDHFGFQNDRLDFEIELLTYEEAGIAAEDVYTVRVVDEYGEPASHVLLSVFGMIHNGLSGDRYSGVTNMEGCFSFCFDRDVDVWWKIKVMNNLDYYDTAFSFDAGTRQMQLQLDLHHEPGEKYTYKVHVYDQFEEGVPGVEIAYTHPDGTVKHYTSDEKGMISFQTEEADPANVKFYVTSVPEDYATNRPDDALYSFPYYSRSLNISLIYDGNVDYTILVLDDEGAPIKGAKVKVTDVGTEYYAYTDEQGRCIFNLSSVKLYGVYVVSVPDSYGHLEFYDQVIEPGFKELVIHAMRESNDGDYFPT